MKIKPTGDRLVVLPDPKVEISKGGIIIPEQAQEKPFFGKVVECGPGKIDEPMSCAVGDRVMYNRYAGNEIEIGDIKYLVMRDSDIYAIIED